MLKTAVKRGVPIAAVIGGGYSRDIDRLALRHSIVHRAATQVNETDKIGQTSLLCTETISLKNEFSL